LAYIYAAESIHVSSTTFTQSAQKATEFGEITQPLGLLRRKVSKVHERYRRQTTDRRQTDRRQTDGRTTTYSEHEHEFTFANKTGAELKVDDDDEVSNRSFQSNKAGVSAVKHSQIKF